ncbi:MAG: hypothetical protein KatS3mg057_2088 [Herpetosiphonaceae bacterium]|nr:MAG: hypothetical protein KatS3mg057_2088 [Herpetosiphonaceae bacterium]
MPAAAVGRETPGAEPSAVWGPSGVTVALPLVQRLAATTASPALMGRSAAEAQTLATPEHSGIPGTQVSEAPPLGGALVALPLVQRLAASTASPTLMGRSAVEVSGAGAAERSGPPGAEPGAVWRSSGVGVALPLVQRLAASTASPTLMGRSAVEVSGAGARVSAVSPSVSKALVTLPLVQRLAASTASPTLMGRNAAEASGAGAAERSGPPSAEPGTVWRPSGVGAALPLVQRLAASTTSPALMGHGAAQAQAPAAAEQSGIPGAEPGAVWRPSGVGAALPLVQRLAASTASPALMGRSAVEVSGAGAAERSGPPGAEPGAVWRSSGVGVALPLVQRLAASTASPTLMGRSAVEVSGAGARVSAVSPSVSKALVTLPLVQRLAASTASPTLMGRNAAEASGAGAAERSGPPGAEPGTVWRPSGVGAALPLVQRLAASTASPALMGRGAAQAQAPAAAEQSGTPGAEPGTVWRPSGVGAALPLVQRLAASTASPALMGRSALPSREDVQAGVAEEHTPVRDRVFPASSMAMRTYADITIPLLQRLDFLWHEAQPSPRSMSMQQISNPQAAAPGTLPLIQRRDRGGPASVLSKSDLSTNIYPSALLRRTSTPAAPGQIGTTAERLGGTIGQRMLGPAARSVFPMFTALDSVQPGASSAAQSQPAPPLVMRQPLSTTTSAGQHRSFPGHTAMAARSLAAGIEGLVQRQPAPTAPIVETLSGQTGAPRDSSPFDFVNPAHAESTVVPPTPQPAQPTPIQRLPALHRPIEQPLLQPIDTSRGAGSIDSETQRTNAPGMDGVGMIQRVETALVHEDSQSDSQLMIEAQGIGQSIPQHKDQDIEALALKVYARLRRRLMVDAERFRGRGY